MKLSLVISTYNRGRQLLRTLDSVARQTLPAGEWELVVVDNNSTDDTSALFAAFAAAHPALDTRMVREPNQGLSWARNRGVAESRGGIIVMIDDDEEINPGFLAAYADFFASHPRAVAAGGKMIACYEQGRPRWMSRYTEALAASTIDLGDRTRPFPRGRYPIGGNMAFRREVFERHGLFDTDLGRTGDKLIGGEEKDLFGRICGNDHGHSGGNGHSGFIYAESSNHVKHGRHAHADHSTPQIWWVPAAAADHIIPPSRLTREHFTRLSRMVGVSGRIMARSTRGGYIKALVREEVKWWATLLLALWFTATARPSKALWLILMRWHITLGLLSC